MTATKKSHLRHVVGLALSLALMATAAAVPLSMGRRDAPAADSRDAATPALVQGFIEAPLRVIGEFPTPSLTEALSRKRLRRGNEESISFGRTPVSLGIEGRFEVPAGEDQVRIRVTSKGALGVRSAWRFGDDAAYEIVVRDEHDPGRLLINRNGEGMNPDPSLGWSAATAGETQEVLIRRLAPAGGPWSVALERVAHFDRPLAGPAPGFNLKELGDSAYCQNDIRCLLDVIPPSSQDVVLAASRGVAHMTVTDKTGSSWYCTGTLLNSDYYPVPLFITANHCVDGGVALDTRWFYSRAYCGYGDVSPGTQVTSGARILWSSAVHDSALLQLSTPPPSQASYAGWDANVVRAGTDMLALHHPRGDVKKASFGTVLGVNATSVVIGGVSYPARTFYMADWELGIVEPGSSGSGFFTVTPNVDAVLLQGTLTGGAVTCSGIASRTYYSRLDAIYPYIVGYLTAPTAPGTNKVVEYYHAGFDHYFITPDPNEIAALDAGAFGGVWKRTGLAFKAYAAPIAGSSTVCRFFSTSFSPKSSHFYTASAAECNGLLKSPDWQFENFAFDIGVPNASGSCPAGTLPVYRLYNQGQGGAPNHRFTTDLATRNHMVGARHWLGEGAGALGVGFCAPQ